MLGKRVFRRRVVTGIVSVAGLSVLATAGAGLVSTASAGAAVAAAPAPSWKIVKSVNTGMASDFATVVASSATTGWAFDGQGYPGAPAPVGLPAHGRQLVVVDEVVEVSGREGRGDRRRRRDLGG